MLAGSTVSEARLFEPTNADSPMEAMPEPRWSEVRAVSLEKAPLPIEVTESGSVAEVSAVVSKALSPTSARRFRSGRKFTSARDLS